MKGTILKFIQTFSMFNVFVVMLMNQLDVILVKRGLNLNRLQQQQILPIQHMIQITVPLQKQR